MSHLRALKDTFLPQTLVVTTLLLGFIPIIWLKHIQGDVLCKIINIQSGFIILIVSTLILRIYNTDTPKHYKEYFL
jgi:hypothetical protein